MRRSEDPRAQGRGKGGQGAGEQDGGEGEEREQDRGANRRCHSASTWPRNPRLVPLLGLEASETLP
eukprot:1944401-Pyramimonas_sp.AAC.1